MFQVEADEQYLVEMATDALRETLKREPTRQEIWKAHAGFKRMALILLEHIDRERNELRKQQQAERTDPSADSTCPEAGTASPQEANS